VKVSGNESSKERKFHL